MRHRLDECIAQVVVHQLFERPAAIHAGVEDHAESARLQKVFGTSAGVGVDELLIPFGTEKSVGSEEGPGTHPRDDGELRPHSCLRESYQSARAERPVGAAARKSEDGDGFTSSQILSSPRHTGNGDIREAVIGPHHPDAARRVSRGLQRRRRLPHDSTALKAAKAEDAHEQDGSCRFNERSDVGGQCR